VRVYFKRRLFDGRQYFSIGSVSKCCDGSEVWIDLATLEESSGKLSYEVELTRGLNGDYEIESEYAELIRCPSCGVPTEFVDSTGVE
jgi:hypothetical protein